MLVACLGRPALMLRAIGPGVVLAIGLVGCGGPEQKSGLPLIPVAGTVTLDGQPLADADLQFIPEGDTKGQGGYGRTGRDGSYTVSTPFGEPGLAAGAYRVVIQKLVAPASSAASGPIDPNIPPIESPYREALPLIYSDQNATTLRATVPPDPPKPSNFALKSAIPGKKPS